MRREGPAPPTDVTGLAAWPEGDRAALDRLVPLVECDVDGTADVLGVHPETVNRDWQRSEGFPLRELAAR